MPFGIKGKTKKWEEGTKTGQKVDASIDACVKRLMADPDFKPKAGEDKKTAAIKVCKVSITRSKEFSKQLSK
ncbi:MAG: hypothetical protein PHQ59_01860 [Candidatus Daviesbacteria bacterium]|nr:hypothetical protein [Candidatus Daviesbacteria bacterium]